jgi:hypothetical protein
MQSSESRSITMIDLGDELANFSEEPKAPLPQSMPSAGRLADLQAQGFNTTPPPEDLLPDPNRVTAYDRPMWAPPVLPPYLIATQSADGGITYSMRNPDDQGS